MEAQQMIVVVFGTRTFNDYPLMEQRLNYLFSQRKPDKIISGGASGADTLARRYAEEHGIVFEEYPAAWDDLDATGAVVKQRKDGQLYNAKAGFDRNEVMANLATHGVAFWDQKSRGTKHTVELLRRLGKPVKIVKI